MGAEAEPEAKPEAEADPYLLYGHGAGYYGGHLGYYGGLRYYGKRSADAEADPYLLYGGLGYGHLGYAGHLGYYGHGLGYVYGKRSADAEAKPDPYLLWRTPWIWTPRICRTRTLWIRIRQIL